eukprot:416550-Rhodomonas_salina.3
MDPRPARHCARHPLDSRRADAVVGQVEVGKPPASQQETIRVRWRDLQEPARAEAREQMARAARGQPGALQAELERTARRGEVEGREREVRDARALAQRFQQAEQQAVGGRVTCETVTAAVQPKFGQRPVESDPIGETDDDLAPPPGPNPAVCPREG